LCGARAAEFTIAGTSQCLNPVRRDWAFDMLAKLDLPSRIFPKVVPPGTFLGRLRESVCAQTGLGSVRVVAPAAHDTASAVAAIPTAGTGRANWAYISSGTWSVMGVETPNALLSERVLELNLTNEGPLAGATMQKGLRSARPFFGLWRIGAVGGGGQRGGGHHRPG
jgi:rhamnulokinase